MFLFPAITVNTMGTLLGAEYILVRMNGYQSRSYSFQAMKEETEILGAQNVHVTAAMAFARENGISGCFVGGVLPSQDSVFVKVGEQGLNSETLRFTI